MQQFVLDWASSFVCALLEVLQGEDQYLFGLQTFSLDKAAEEGSVQIIETLLLLGVGVNNVFRKVRLVCS